MQFVCGVYCG